MSIVTEIERLQTAKEDIKNAIVEKGGVILEGSTIDTYSEVIKELETGGGKIEECFIMTPPANTSIVNCIKTIPEIDTSQYTGVQGMFYGLTGITTIPLINTSNITNMKNMFYECSKLQTIPQIDTSKATTMEQMFYKCTSLKGIPLLDTKNVTNMDLMCYQCSSLKEIPSLDTRNVVYVRQMFYQCSQLTTVGQLDGGSVKYIESMFTSCSNLKNFGGIKDLGKSFYQQMAGHHYHTLTLSGCPYITHDSLMNVINNLYDLNITYDVANGGTLYSQKLILGATNKNKLTAEEIAIATNKGWTVS